MSDRNGQKARWDELHRRILGGLDIAGVYRSMGVDITGDRPNAQGWLACRAKGRKDEHASAAINVAGDGLALGRYRDKGGSGDSLSLWDFAARHGGFGDWREARRKFAALAGVKLPRGNEPKRLTDSVEWSIWIKDVARQYCRAKEDKIIQPWALEDVGARRAYYPAGAPKCYRQEVFCLPVFGQHLTDAEPVGWVAVDAAGGDVRKFEGKDKPVKMVKTLCLAGSETGLMNAWAVSHWDEVEVVWKVEGVSDMLTLHSMIPAELKTKHVVITTAFGAGDPVQDWWVQLLALKKVYAVGDRDRAGEEASTCGSRPWPGASPTCTPSSCPTS